jgi:hypothetical protein
LRTVSITWEDPPARRLSPQARRAQNDQILAQLQDNPNQWAVLERGLTYTAARGRFNRWRKYGCEVALVPDNADDAQGAQTMYVRWVTE